MGIYLRKIIGNHRIITGVALLYFAKHSRMAFMESSSADSLHV